MIIDFHVHICPPQVRQNREPFLSGEPDFAAIYRDPKAKLVGTTNLISKMDQEQVDKAVVFGFPWRKPENFQLNNDYVLAAAKRFPERLIPYCCLAADYPQAEQEIERCFKLGVKGVGELGFYQTGLDNQALKALEPILYTCKNYNLPVLLHTNEPVGHYYPGKSPMNLRQLYNLIKSFPDITWILAHAGGGLPFFAQMKKEVIGILDNCWFDTAALPFLFKPKGLKLMLESFSADKFLFGTDYPLLPPSRYYSYFQTAELTQEEQGKIMGLNALRLLSM